jgi:hypothetical protein
MSLLPILAIALVLCTPHLVGARGKKLVNPLAPSPESKPPSLFGELEAPRPFTACPQPPPPVVYVQGFGRCSGSKGEKDVHGFYLPAHALRMGHAHTTTLRISQTTTWTASTPRWMKS